MDFARSVFRARLRLSLAGINQPPSQAPKRTAKQTRAMATLSLVRRPELDDGDDDGELEVAVEDARPVAAVEEAITEVDSVSC